MKRQFFQYVFQNIAGMIGVSVYILADTFFISVSSGADAVITELEKNYVQIFMTATPFFMINYVFTAFARNDNAPGTAMIGAISGSLFNIVFDYIFMFPMGMGLTGAAMATVFSPVVTSLICCTHYFGKKILFALNGSFLPYGSCLYAADLAYQLLWGRFLPPSQLLFLIC